ncbi:MAG: hypothetical protein AAF599_01585 [Bacteroidota bacterium]
MQQAIQELRVMLADLLNQLVTALRPIAQNREADHRARYLTDKNDTYHIGGNECDYVIQYNIVNEGCNSCVVFKRNGMPIYTVNPDCNQASAGLAQNVFWEEEFTIEWNVIDPNATNTKHRVRIVETYLKSCK